MTRKMDELGRLVIPKEMREQLEIDKNTILKIELEDNRIVISKDDSDYSKMLYANEELTRKVMYYERLLEENNISYLK
ncbi:MAG TPA: AbrB/MazE/SpoVT family DNA-binding domain-containing protein [Candidatus Onthousia faecavium]|nr:AbrB/MazE/SpoVT family DNA-binding domain-containing protein [Candidatus Onthousia faecavium]